MAVSYFFFSNHQMHLPNLWLLALSKLTMVLYCLMVYNSLFSSIYSLSKLSIPPTTTNKLLCSWPLIYHKFTIQNILKAYNTAICVGLHHNLVECSRFLYSVTLETSKIYTLWQNALEFCRNSFAFHDRVDTSTTINKEILEFIS